MSSGVQSPVARETQNKRGPERGGLSIGSPNIMLVILSTTDLTDDSSYPAIQDLEVNLYDINVSLIMTITVTTNATLIMPPTMT